MTQATTESVENAEVDAVTAPLQALRPPTYGRLAAAHRQGQDPNRLLEDFKRSYHVAVDETERIIEEIAGDDWDLRCRLWDEANAYAEERRHWWWVVPQQMVARILNPGMRPHELARMGHQLRTNIYVGFTVTVTRNVRGGRPTRPGRVTVTRRRREAIRSAAPTRGDPDDEPGEQTWALTFVDRAPVFWRFRAARCRLLEVREAIRMGVDR